MSTYKLESENLECLDGRMGTESTSTNWVKYFTSIEDAKKFAEKDYKGNIGEWIVEKKKGKDITKMRGLRSWTRCFPATLLSLWTSFLAHAETSSQ